MATTAELMAKAAREIDDLIDSVRAKTRDFIKSRGGTDEEVEAYHESEDERYAAWREETLKKIRGFIDRDGETAH